MLLFGVTLENSGSGLYMNGSCEVISKLSIETNTGPSVNFLFDPMLFSDGDVQIILFDWRLKLLFF